MGIAEAHPAHASGNRGHCTHGIRVFVFATQVKWICCSCALSKRAKIALTEWRPLSSPSPNERTLSPRLFIWQSEPARFDTRKETSFGAFRAPFYRAPPSSSTPCSSSSHSQQPTKTNNTCLCRVGSLHPPSFPPSFSLATLATSSQIKLCDP